MWIKKEEIWHWTVERKRIISGKDGVINMTTMTKIKIESQLKKLYIKREKLIPLVGKEYLENRTGYMGKAARELHKLDGLILNLEVEKKGAK